MSATSRPDWGRASGALSIFTATDGREAVAPVSSGRPVRGASGDWLTVPSETTVLVGVTEAAFCGPSPLPLQAAVTSETRPRTTGIARRRGTQSSL